MPSIVQLQVATPPLTCLLLRCPYCKTLNYAVEYRGVKTKEEKGIEQLVSAPHKPCLCFDSGLAALVSFCQSVGAVNLWVGGAEGDRGADQDAAAGAPGRRGTDEEQAGRCSG